MGSEVAGEEVKTAGPWSRLHDSSSPLSRVPGAARIAKNVYRDVADSARPLVARPGRTRVGTNLGGGNALVTGLIGWGKKDGTQFTTAVSGTEFFAFSWATLTWTKVVSVANLAAAGITLSGLVRTAMVPFADVLVISDGSNIPFTWNGTSGAGGLVKLTNCPPLFGLPTQHYGRLFGIKASDRATIVWSEVLQPNTGYEAAGFANAWTVTQTDTDPFHALVGSNDGLYAFRERSTTLLIGRPDLNFSGSATRDAVDQTTGTASPWAIVQTSKGLFVHDADYRARLFRAGGSPEAAWLGFADTLPTLLKDAVVAANDPRSRAVGVYHPTLNVYIVGVPVDTEWSNSPSFSSCLVYDAEPEVPTPVATWSGWTDTTMLAVVQDSQTNQVRLMSSDLYGDVYLHGTPTGPVWNDDRTTNVSGVVRAQVGIEYTVETQSLGFDLKRQWWFNRIDLEVGAMQASALSVYRRTPQGQTASPSFLPPATTADKHYSLGIEDEGRHISVGVSSPAVIRAALTAPPFSLYAVAVTAVPADTDPAAP